MLTSLLVAGFGGQGAMTIGKLIAECGFAQGMKTTFFPTYGPEQRGGTANCTVILSDREIGSPLTDAPDVLMVMNQLSFDKFVGRVKSGGIVITNASLVDSSNVQRADITVIPVQADEIAHKIGSEKVSNIVMTAAYMEVSKAMPIDDAKRIVMNKMAKKPELMEMNDRAFDMGVEEIKRRVK